MMGGIVIKRIVSVLLLAATIMVLCACNLDDTRHDIYSYLEENASMESSGIDTAAEAQQALSGGSTTTYVGGYYVATTLISAIQQTLTGALLAYNNANYDSSVNITYSCFDSDRFAMTSGVGTGTQETWTAPFTNRGYKDVTCTNDTANTYVFTYTSTSSELVTEQNPNGNCTCTVVCDYDPATGSLRYVYSVEGVVKDYFILAPQGSSIYALEDMYSRAVVIYADGIVSALVYGERMNDTASEQPDVRPYPLTENDIYKKTGYSLSWVTGDKENLQRLTVIQNNVFTLDRCTRTATAGDPPSYSWVWADTATMTLPDVLPTSTPTVAAASTSPAATPSGGSPSPSTGATTGTGTVTPNP